MTYAVIGIIYLSAVFAFFFIVIFIMATDRVVSEECRGAWWTIPVFAVIGPLAFLGALFCECIEYLIEKARRRK